MYYSAVVLLYLEQANNAVIPVNNPTSDATVETFGRLPFNNAQSTFPKTGQPDKRTIRCLTASMIFRSCPCRSKEQATLHPGQGRAYGPGR
jgi:hypothetical protein